jgi:alkaline phosphatase D
MAVSRRRFVLGVLTALVGCTRSARDTGPAVGPDDRAGDAAPAPANPGSPADPADGADDRLVDARAVPAAPELADDPFLLGVASGDPVPDGVVLWTRALPRAADGGPVGLLTLVWEVTPAGEPTGEPGEEPGAGPTGDAAFERLAATGTAETGPDVGHSVHVEVSGLEPDRWYRYRFRLGPWTSPVGRTRTAPAPDAPAGSLRLAVASCQDWQSGFYTAYPHVTADRPDLVLFCGDYIYEAGPTEGAVRPHDGAEATTLEEYRSRYALYRSDPALRAAHGACPWVVAWDDHEVANGYAGLFGPAGPPGAGSEPGSDAGSDDAAQADAFFARRTAAYRAWWEHMPVRGPAPSGPDLTVHRSLRWGRLAQLVVLDGRQYRSERPCGDGLVDVCDELGRADATMLGADQEAWLSERLVESRAAGVVWTVVVNQTLLTELPVPGGAGGTAQVYADGWDGYPAARARLLGEARRVGVANLVVVSGDLHASLVGDLRLDGGTIGTEFLGPGVSSAFAAGRAGVFALAPLLLPQVVMADGRYRGYLRCELDPGRWRTDYRWVSTVDRRDADLVADAPAFEVRAGTPGARELSPGER